MLLNDPSTVRRPTGNCGSPGHAAPFAHAAEMGVLRLTWFGPDPRSTPPAELAWATSMAWKMNRRSSALMVNPFPTGAVCACADVIGYRARSRAWLSRSVLRQRLLSLIFMKLICKYPLIVRPALVALPEGDVRRSTPSEGIRQTTHCNPSRQCVTGRIWCGLSSSFYNLESDPDPAATGVRRVIFVTPRRQDNPRPQNDSCRTRQVSGSARSRTFSRRNAGGHRARHELELVSITSGEKQRGRGRRLRSKLLRPGPRARSANLE